MKKTLICGCFLGLALAPIHAEEAHPPPVRYAIVGLVHDHAQGFIPGAMSRPDVQLVGIVEPDHALAARYAARHHLDPGLFCDSLKELMARTKVQAVATFTHTLDHRRVVEECAPLGIDVMMEKPLAVDLTAARAIADAARKGGIRIIVNYETTWYPGNQEAYRMVCDQGTIGELRKIVVHDGHQGPVEIGCSPDFLNWLTDPVLNGGGALMDFGCYGANQMTWLMRGQRPTSVFAVTQHIKPDVYPKVEDEATIVVTYPKTQGIIQASWNWPYNRKDLEIYGQTGYVLVPASDQLRVLEGKKSERTLTTPAAVGPHANPLAYLAAVVRREIEPSGPSSLEVNLVAMEILDAARKSAETGKRVDLPK